MSRNRTWKTKLRTAATAAALIGAVVAGGINNITDRSTAPANGATPTSAATETAPPEAPGKACPSLAPPGRIGAPIDTAAVRAVLDCLPVKGRAPLTGYGRVAKFGAAWSVTGANGCDTQSRILVRDLAAITYKSRCTVLAGRLEDPYTGKVINYVRGGKTADNHNLVELDHVVPLALAWQKGAQMWTQERRVAYANDPDVVLAVDGPSNNQKRDADAATWLPSNKAFRQEYAARIVYILNKYGMPVFPPEKTALTQLLRGER